MDPVVVHFPVGTSRPITDCPSLEGKMGSYDPSPDPGEMPEE